MSSGRLVLALLNGYAPSWVESVAPRIAGAWGLEVATAGLQVDLARCYAADRRQYAAPLILASILRQRPPASSIVGLTRVDLFIPVLTFVFGQAQLGGPAALVSTCRLRPEFYGLPLDEKVLVTRTVKEVVHEVGHTLGLIHCDEFECVMHASTCVEEVDLKGERPCPACARGAARGRSATEGVRREPPAQDGPRLRIGA